MGWVVGKALDLVLGRAVAHEPWPATTREGREHYPEGIEGLELLQRELNVNRRLRRANAERFLDGEL